MGALFIVLSFLHPDFLAVRFAVVLSREQAFIDLGIFLNPKMCILSLYYNVY